MSTITLPGLIDPHVHLRDPGQINKEDFYTGSCSAIAGGFTTILDMPNNKIPITTFEKLNEKIKIAKKKIICDVGFYFGSLGDNLEEFKKIQNKVLGLKLYLNQTTGNFLIDEAVLEKTFNAWKKTILVHAEDKMLDTVIRLAKKLRKKVHVCHISTALDLKKIIKAKRQGLKITCGVTPHHLFLTERDAKRLGGFGKMKPPLQSKKDQDFLWKNLKYIDVIESDHAPHTIEEKGGSARGGARGRASDPTSLGSFEGQGSACTGGADERSEELACLTGVGGNRATGPRATPPAFGVPGLETTLPLLLTAMNHKRLTINDIIRLCHTNPAKIFNIKTDPKTKIEVDLNSSFIINNSSLFTKCGWSPFDGFKVKGKVVRVFIRGKKIFENGKILAKKGSGKILND